MFNGLIREIAEVVSFENNFLKLKAKFRPNLGDSVAVNGACLSVVSLFEGGFCVELSDESRKNLALENYKNKVHIEPAMRLGDRIDGHLLQGHIDGIGIIRAIENRQNSQDFYIEIPQNLMHLMANKGSIAVDGVSLTINEILDYGIRLTIIPLSLKDSLFGEFKVGRRVNLESDLLARYVERMLKFDNKLTWQKADLYASLY